MNILLLFTFIVFGFLFLLKGADYLVDGSSALARKLAIPEIVIGLTVISLGTSVPELVVNVFASIAEKSEIVLGNIIGSNLINVLVILGVAGLICPLAVEKNSVWKEIPFVLFAVILLGVMVNDGFKAASVAYLSCFEGLILLFFLVVFIIYIYKIARVQVDYSPQLKLYSGFKTAALIAGGFTGLFLGGKLVVDSGVKLARVFGVTEKLIALTIIAIGSSLPELITSSVAAFKKRPAIAVGNVLGSNIFNIFLVLGISSLIHPVKHNPALNVDIGVLLLGSVLLFLFMFTGKKHKLDRWEAALFLGIYTIYFAYLIFRG